MKVAFAIPASLTIILVFIIFVPIVHPDTEYVSISLWFGGWGLLFQQGGVWYYYIGFWSCFYGCQLSSTVTYWYIFHELFPFAGIFWSLIGLLALADLLSIVIIARKHPTKVDTDKKENHPT